MKRLIIAALPLCLPACTTLQKVDCAKADKVRAAATLALQTLDRVCPAPGLTVPQ